jgi:radical SAM superfamily enzyme YgiQ (UPF0313 family)
MSHVKVRFVNPAFPESLWSFRGLSSFVGKKKAFIPLGLVTVAACTPPGFDVAICDEEVGPIDLDMDADILALTAYSVQAFRAFDLAREFRRRGKLVAMGGPYASLCPDKCKPHVDVLLEGEAELIWPQFLMEYRERRHRSHYKQVERVSMQASPVPRFDLLRRDDYFEFAIQTSRGCPFTCEFCDIIVTDGRIPRTKSVEQVLAEVRALHSLGVASVSFTDANFIGNPNHAKRLLEALIEFGREHDFPLSFACEATVNLAGSDREDILGLMQAANFGAVFVGIESPRKSSLVETKKLVNTRGTLIDHIRKIQSFGMIVVAGMIVGFDSDDKDIFQEQFDFLSRAGIPFTTLGTLVALENTPLHGRLAGEKRLLESSLENFRGHGASDTNFVPRQMTLTELRHGFNWLIRALYAYDTYADRVLIWLDNYSSGPNSRRYKENTLDLLAFMNVRNPVVIATIILRVLWYYLAAGSKRRRFFAGTLYKVCKGGVTIRRLAGVIGFLVLHRHFHEYVTAAHGDPETVPLTSPYTRLNDESERSHGRPADRNQQASAFGGV